MRFIDWLRNVFGPRPDPGPNFPIPLPPGPVNPTTLLGLHNAARSVQGIAMLTEHPLLTSSAQGWANWMAKNNELIHSADGHTLQSRVSASYKWRTLGENIAEGARDEHEVFQMWMNSSGHRTNILNPTFRDVGFGKAVASNGTIYWCVDFGSTDTTNEVQVWLSGNLRKTA